MNNLLSICYHTLILKSLVVFLFVLFFMHSTTTQYTVQTYEQKLPTPNKICYIILIFTETLLNTNT